jgi:uncharacterized membrane protein YadS
MGISGLIILIVLATIFIVWLEIIIGKYIGKHLPRATGMLIGALFIVCGISFVIGITTIIYCQNNRW